MDSSDISVSGKKPNKFNQLWCFVWYLIKSPFEILTHHITHIGDFIKELRKPTRWLSIWVLVMITYQFLFWQKQTIRHYVYLTFSLAILLLWYVYERGDWREGIKEQGKP